MRVSTCVHAVWPLKSIAMVTNLKKVLSGAPLGRVDLLGPTYAFGAGCFFVFGLIYLVLLESRFMLVSNFIFGGLICAMWHLQKRRTSLTFRTHVFLALVYLGLVNVVFQIGVHEMPMIYWGLSVPIAAAFLCDIRGIVIWAALGFLFYPLNWALKVVVFPAVGIDITHEQWDILRIANYSGLLTFLLYSFFLFNQKLSQSLVSLDRRKSELEGLLRMISHDLATPSNVLRYHSESIKKKISNSDKLGPEDFKKMIDYSEKNIQIIDKIDGLIKDVRIYAKESLVAAKNSDVGADVVSALREAAESVEKAFGEKNIKITVRSSAQEPLLVGVSRDRLGLQVFGNLFTNAAKFSDLGGSVEVIVTGAKHEVIVAVQDHGVGMSDRMIAQLFNPGQSLSTSGTSGEVGTGFGLLIVHATLEKCGASIHVSSRERQVSPKDSGTLVTMKFRRVAC